MLSNLVHLPTYFPGSNSIGYCTGIHPVVGNISNFIHITRLSGSPLVSIDDDAVWKDRPFVKNILNYASITSTSMTCRRITLVENGAIMGMKPFGGRWLLVNVRLFKDPTAHFIPRVRSFCSENSSVNYNQLPPSGLRACGELIVPSEVDSSPEAREECLKCTNVFEEQLRFSSSGKVDTLDDTQVTLELSQTFELHLWDLKELKVAKQFKGHVGLSDIDNAFLVAIEVGETPDLPYIATGSEDGGIFFFHKAHGPTPVKVLREHSALVNNVGFHPNGKFMVSASDDMSVRLWTISDKGCN